jgi:hypothetical protein
MAVERRARRRWLQFSLGGILALITAIGAALGLYVNRVQRQREVVALVKQHAGELAYDYQRDRKGRPPGPKRARAWLGDDFFSDLIVVSAPGIKADDSRLRFIGSLRRLEYLSLQDCAAGDDVFRHFSGLTELEQLNLGDTHLFDTGLIELNRLTKLRRLDLHQTKITDAGLRGLREMADLTHLNLSGVAIGDDGLKHIQHLPRLRFLNLNGTQVSDQGLNTLNRLPALAAVSLHGSRVTDAGLRGLKACGTLEKPTAHVLDILHALADKTELEFKNQPLPDVLEYFGARHDIPVVLDGRSKVVSSRPNEAKVTANARGLLFADALKSILEPLGMTYAIRHGVLFITESPCRPAMRIRTPSSATQSSAELLTKLDQPADGLGFVDAPLGGLFVALKNRYAITIRLDETQFPTEADFDECLETPVMIIKAKGVSLRSALELALDACEMDCRIEGDDLVVAPRKKAPAGH